MAVPFWGYFWSMLVFPLVIHSGMSISWKHLFISIASLSWIEVIFLNKNPCLPSRPGLFQLGIFLSVALSKSMSIFTLGLFSTLCCSFFHVLYPFVFYCYNPSVPKLCFKILLPPLHPVDGLSSPILSLLDDRIFLVALCCLVPS